MNIKPRQEVVDSYYMARLFMGAFEGRRVGESWHQMVSVPTHRLGNTLDLCLVSSLELVAGMEVIAPLTDEQSGECLSVLEIYRCQEEELTC